MSVTKLACGLFGVACIGLCACDSVGGSDGTEQDGMVLVTAGVFGMGCYDPIDESYSSSTDPEVFPYHQVDLRSYFIDKTEVTIGAFKKCVDAGACSHHMDDGTCYYPDGSDNDWVSGVLPSSYRGNSQPAVCVDWNQAKAYCEWAGKRLPTEAEWEKAARGTDKRKYPWGTADVTCDLAVINDIWNSWIDGCGTWSTWNVCSRSPAGDSPYGLCDMAGNVYEWVFDWFGENYYGSSPSANPTGPASGTFRGLRGGGFSSDDAPTRTADRRYAPPAAFSSDIGFRCVRDAE